MDCNHPKAPTRAAKILRKRIHTNRVVRNFCHEGTESRHEGSIDIIGDYDQVRTFALNQTSQPLHRTCTHGHGRWIAGIDKEQRLDRGICQPVNFCIWVLPCVATITRRDFIRLDLSDFKIEAVKVADLDIRGERLYSESNLIPPMQQVIYD